jgi:hypothetical protein
VRYIRERLPTLFGGPKMGENPDLEAHEKPSSLNGEGSKEGFFEPLLERLKKREEKKSAKKVQQIIWLEPKVFAKVLELAEALDLAANRTIELIVEDYIMRRGDLEKAMIMKEVVKCPECGQGFETINEWLIHMKNKSDEARSLVYKLLELRK